jgi:hypothetical protein
LTQVNAHQQRRLAALHEYRLLDAPADDELEADGGGTVVSVTLPGA